VRIRFDDGPNIDVPILLHERRFERRLELMDQVELRVADKAEPVRAYV